MKFGTSPDEAVGRRRGPWRLRRGAGGWLWGIRPGRPVTPLALVSSRPWVPPALLLGLGLLAIAASQAAGSSAPAAQLARWWAQHPLRERLEALPVGSVEIAAVLAGFVFLFGVSSWSWPLRLTGLLAAWAFATYQLGLLSFGAIEEMVYWLASQPGVDVFDPPPRGSIDASIVLAFFAVLMPIIALVLLFLVWAWSSFVAEILRPIASERAVPDWALMVPVLGGLAAVAYTFQGIWLPWVLWVLGVVARALVLVRG